MTETTVMIDSETRSNNSNPKGEEVMMTGLIAKDEANAMDAVTVNGVNVATTNMKGTEPVEISGGKVVSTQDVQPVDEGGAVFVDVDTIVERDEFRIRAKLDKGAVEKYTKKFEDYREALEVRGDAKYPFPGILLWHDRGENVILGGNHRTAAARAAGQFMIKAIFFHGTFDEAYMAALQDNNSHGRELSNSDKKFAIKKTLSKYPLKTLRQVAEMIGCSHSYVDKIRKKMVANGELREPEKCEGTRSNKRKKADSVDNTPPSDEPKQTTIQVEIIEGITCDKVSSQVLDILNRVADALSREDQVSIYRDISTWLEQSKHRITPLWNTHSS